MNRRARSPEPNTRNVRQRTLDARSRVLPRYYTSVSIADNNTHMINVRPIFSGGINADGFETRRLIANALVQRIRREARANGIVGPPRVIDPLIRGTLTAVSIEGPQRSVGSRVVGINNITPEFIEDLFSMITQSNENMLIYQVQWNFIIDRGVFISGASNNVTIPKWWGRKKDLSWGRYEDELGFVSCAAVALVLAMNGSKYEMVRYDLDKARLVNDARLLQQEMNWNQVVTGSELSDFVLKYPDYRLTILMSEKNSSEYTFTGSDFVKANETIGKTPSAFYLYIYFDLIQKHYATVRHPQNFYRNKLNSKSLNYCHACTTVFGSHTDHVCEDNEYQKVVYDKSCPKCHLVNCKKCKYITCKNCAVVYDKDHGQEKHRCMIVDFFKEDTGYNVNENDGKKPALWVYDLESRIETTVVEPTQVGVSDDEGYYSGDVEFVQVKNLQIANFVYAINVFTGQELQYFGENCIHDFMTYMMNFNEGIWKTKIGHSILLAHNAGAYDTRLIYEDLIKRKNKIMMSTIMTGSKFIQLQVGSKLFLRDSRMHLNGSLAGLAKDFETPTLKGYFPHLFNSIENYMYKGPIPAKEFFDLSHFKNDKDLETFNKWHDEYEGDWEFMVELCKYCINDVKVLASVVQKYHEIYMEKFEQSPWKSITSSSYFHMISKQMVTRDLELPDKKDEMYASAIAEKYRDSWTVLKAVEYASCRKALRGGRTGIGRILCELDNEQIARGCKIKYVDVVSLYPYQQVAHQFPVGPPTINVFDKTFAPCYKHRNSLEVHCDCEDSKRYHTQEPFISNQVETVFHSQEWDVNRILNKHGFVMATVQPPMILHPVLVRYDEEDKKCNATCELIEKGCFTSVEFHTALKNGYSLIKLHRFDEYKMKDPLWEDFVKEMYIFKMVNSGNAPEGQKRQDLIDTYESKFEMGAMIEKTFDPNIWGKNPAKKAAAKTGLNSGWGKHAQRPILTKTRYINWQNQDSKKQGDLLFQNVQNDMFSLQAGFEVGEEKFLYQYKENGEKMNHDFSNSYLPAACFVPAYGRLQLWEQLNKLGDRVLMYDTDSVVYIYDPDEYNVAESKIWGEWEEEDISVTGITGFVGLGPKSYSLRCADESMNVVKLKGISQKRATDKILNYDILREMVLENIATRTKQEIKVPQTVFEYQMTKGIFTKHILKLLSFDFQDQKGQVGKNMFMYPRGYIGDDFNPL